MKIDLGHVHGGDQNHGRGTEEVHPAQNAAERRLFGDVPQALEGLAP